MIILAIKEQDEATKPLEISFWYEGSNRVVGHIGNEPSADDLKKAITRLGQLDPGTANAWRVSTFQSGLCIMIEFDNDVDCKKFCGLSRADGSDESVKLTELNLRYAQAEDQTNTLKLSLATLRLGEPELTAWFKKELSQIQISPFDVPGLLARYALANPDAIRLEIAERIAAVEKIMKLRFHECINDAWKYVNIPFVSHSAKSKVGAVASAPLGTCDRVQLIFALQTAWPFIHGSDNARLITEAKTLMRYEFHDVAAPKAPHATTQFGEHLQHEDEDASLNEQPQG